MKHYEFKSKAKVILEIKTCRDCPFLKKTREYTLDGWDSGSDWICEKSNKTIENFVEWHETNKIDIPQWCEFIEK